VAQGREAAVNGGVNPPLRGGDKRGQFVRKKGRGNGPKRGDFRGLFGEIGVKKRLFLARKAGKKALFGVREG